MTELLQEVNLWNNNGRHDKVYNIYLYKKPLADKWTVEVAYGRRGASPTKLTKIEDASYFAANEMFRKLYHEKTRGGYHEFSNRASWGKPNSIKKSFFTAYVTELLCNNIFNSQEYQKIKNLMNSDDESFNLAVGIITAKERKLWAPV